MAFEAGSSTIAKKRATALVVDDCSILRKLTTKLLMIFGFDVSTVNDGAEVVNLYKAGEGHFDLIVTDLEMPVMNGIQAVKELRSMGVGCKIIGATASNDELLKQSFIDAGINHLLDKPLDAAKLKSCLKNE